MLPANPLSCNLAGMPAAPYCTCRSQAGGAKSPCQTDWHAEGVHGRAITVRCSLMHCRAVVAVRMFIVRSLASCAQTERRLCCRTQSHSGAHRRAMAEARKLIMKGCDLYPTIEMCGWRLRGSLEWHKLQCMGQCQDSKRLADLQGNGGGAQAHHEGLRPVPNERGCVA